MQDKRDFPVAGEQRKHEEEVDYYDFGPGDVLGGVHDYHNLVN